MVKRSSRTARKNRRGGGRKTSRRTRRNNHRGGFSFKSLGAPLRGIKRLGRTISNYYKYSSDLQDVLLKIYEENYASLEGDPKIKSINKNDTKYKKARIIKFFENLMEDEYERGKLQEALKKKLNAGLVNIQSSGENRLQALNSILNTFNKGSIIKLDDGDKDIVSLKNQIETLNKEKEEGLEQETEKKIQASNNQKDNAAIIFSLMEKTGELKNLINNRFKEPKDKNNGFIEGIRLIVSIFNKLKYNSLTDKDITKIKNLFSEISELGRVIFGYDDIQIIKQLKDLKNSIDSIIRFENHNNDYGDNCRKLSDDIGKRIEELEGNKTTSDIQNQQVLELLDGPNKTLKMIKEHFDLESEYKRGYNLINRKFFEGQHDHLNRIDIYNIYKLNGYVKLGEDYKNPVKELQIAEKSKKCQEKSLLYLDYTNENSECLSRFGTKLKCLPRGSIVFSIDIWSSKEEDDSELEWLKKRDIQLLQNYVSKMASGSKYITSLNEKGDSGERETEPKPVPAAVPAAVPAPAQAAVPTAAAKLDPVPAQAAVPSQAAVQAAVPSQAQAELDSEEARIIAELADLDEKEEAKRRQAEDNSKYEILNKKYPPDTILIKNFYETAPLDIWEGKGGLCLGSYDAKRKKMRPIGKKFMLLYDEYNEIKKLDYEGKTKLNNNIRSIEKKLSHYKDPKKRSEWQYLGYFRCEPFKVLYNDLLEFTELKLNKMKNYRESLPSNSILLGGGHGGGGKTFEEFYEYCRNPDKSLDIEFEGYIKKQELLYKNSISKTNSNKLILRGPIIVGLPNKNVEHPYTFIKLDCDANLGEYKSHKMTDISEQKSFCEIYNIKDIETLHNVAKDNFEEIADAGGLELLSCLLKSDLHNAAFESYGKQLKTEEGGDTEEYKKLKGISSYITAVDGLITGYKNNIEIKETIRKYKNLHKDKQEKLSFDDYLNKEFAGKQALKTQANKKFNEEIKEIKEKADLIRREAKTLQQRSIFGVAKTNISFYWADQKCYNGLIDWQYDYKDESSNNCKPYLIKREGFIEGKDVFDGQNIIGPPLGRDGREEEGGIDDYKTKLEKDLENLEEEIITYYGDSNISIIDSKFKLKLFEMERLQNLIDSLRIDDLRDLYKSEKEDEDTDTLISYFNPLIQNEIGAEIPKDWLFIAIPMRRVNVFFKENVDIDDNSSYIINDVEYSGQEKEWDEEKKSEQNTKFKYYSNIILVNPDDNPGIWDGKKHDESKIKNFYVLPPNVCINLKGTSGMPGNEKIWKRVNTSWYSNFKYWVKMFSKNMLLKFIAKKLLISLLKLVATIAIGIICPWAIPFITQIKSQGFSFKPSFFTMTGGGGMKMITNDKYHVKQKRTKRTKRTKRRRKRKITKKCSMKSNIK